MTFKELTEEQKKKLFQTVQIDTKNMTPYVRKTEPEKPLVNKVTPLADRTFRDALLDTGKLYTDIGGTVVKEVKKAPGKLVNLITNPKETLIGAGTGVKNLAENIDQSFEEKIMLSIKNIFDKRNYDELLKESRELRAKRELGISQLSKAPIEKNETYQKGIKGELPKAKQEAFNSAQSLGKIGGAALITAATGNPLAGKIAFGVGVQQEYQEQALAEGKSEAQSIIFSIPMTAAETFLEGKLGVGFKAQSKGLLKSAIEEGAEEFVMPYIEEATRAIQFGEKVDLVGTTKEAIASAVDGAVLGLVMQGAQNAVPSAVALKNKIDNKQKITSSEIQQVVQDTQNVLGEDILGQTVQEIVKATNENIGVVDGQVQPTQGTTFAEAKAQLPTTKTQTQEIKPIEQIPTQEEKTVKVPLKEQSNIDNTGKKVPEEIITKLKDSKIKNEKGQLLEVYHATDADFKNFDIKMAQSGNDYGVWGKGLYFANKDTSGVYGKNLKKAYLNMNNPLVLSKFKTIQEIADYLDISESNFKMDETSGLPKIIGSQSGQLSSQAKIMGHDGIVADFKDGWTEYVVFEPEQIIQPDIISKIKTDNNKTRTKPIEELKQQPKIAKILEEKPKVIDQSVPKTIDKIIYETVNKGHYVDKLAKATGNKKLTEKYDNMFVAQAEGNYSIGEAQTNNEGKTIGKSLIEIWKPVNDSGKNPEFSDYLLHKHNIDRMAQGKPVFGEDVTAEMSEQIVKDYEAKNPEFKEWQKDVNKFFKNELQNLVDAGFITEDTQNVLNDMYSNYVKIQRDYQKGGKPIADIGGKLSIKAPIKKATGGNADILPLDEVMAQTVMLNKSLIARNNFGQELYKTIGGVEATEGDIYENLTKNKDGGYSFTVWVDGQKQTITLDEGLYESIKPTKDFAPALLAPFRKLGEFQREVLTGKNPFFMARNFFRDMPDAVLNSKYGKDFPLSYATALKEIATNGEMWKLYRAKGGEQNSYFDYKDGIKAPSNNPAKKFIKGIEQANIIIEQAPRLAEFISTIKNGGTVSEAMYNSAEITTNFKRGGVVTKALNKNGALFLNASVQGLSKQFRNITGQNGVKGYTNLLIKASVMGILPALLNDFLLGDDEDYENLPSTIKDNYYLFKIGDGKFIRIPKGRATGTIGAAARRVLDNDFEDFGQTFATNLAPNNPLEQNVLAPIIQAAANKTWYGGDLVNKRLQGELPKNQFDETTDEFSKVLGKMTNISPKKINYVIDQYGGVLSDILLPPLTKKAETGILKSNFTTDAVLKNKNVGDFYKKLEKATQVKNDSKATDKDLIEYKFLNKVNAEANDIYKQKREIENSKLSDKEKKNQVRQLQREINEIFTNALQAKSKIESNYAEYGDFNFYKDKDNEWQSVEQKEFEKISEFNKNEYFKEYVNVSRIRDKDNGYEKVEKKQKVVDSLLSSKLNDEEKSYLYGKYYSSDKTLNALAKTNIKFDYFLQLQKATAGLEAIDDPKSNIEGKTVSGSKKKQYIKELQSLKTTRTKKLVLLGLDYGLSKQEKTEVFNYINGLKLSASEKKEVLEQMSSFDFYENGQLKGW